MRWLLAVAFLFQDEARQAGLTQVIPNGGDKAKKFIIETTGSGTGLLDFDNDGLLDVLLVSGDTAPSRFYRNSGKGKFEEIGTKLGLNRVGWGQGTCAADFDADGWTDFAITHWGDVALYRNRQGKSVEQIKLPRGSTRYNTGCVFFDYDRDGDLDLFVANYLEFGFETTPLPGSNPFCFYRNVAVNCGPRGLPFARNVLYRNDGNLRFTDVSQVTGIAAPDRNYSLGAVATDVNRDGWPDLYVACDQTPSLLYINQRDGTFNEEALLRGVALDENGKALSGMGVAAGDYDRDGHIDLFRTNFSDERVTLYRNRGDGTFDETTTSAGLGINTREVGWGTAFVDFDNDGWPDLVQVNGHAFPESGRARQRAIVYRNTGGKFVEVEAPAGLHCSRGLAVGDLDNDGTVEVVVNNQNEAPSLWRLAAAAAGNWAMVKAPIGSFVKIRAGGVTQVDEVRSGGSYLSQNDPRVRFGLGRADRVETVEVVLPSGDRRVLRDSPVNRVIELR